MNLNLTNILKNLLGFQRNQDETLGFGLSSTRYDLPHSFKNLIVTLSQCELKEQTDHYIFLCIPGIVNLEFELPYDFPEGWWTIQAVALGQTEETKVLLERWFSHRFDVNVGTEAFVLSSDEYLEGQVLANYTSVATVTGNLTLKTVLRPLGKYRNLGLDWKDRYLEEYVDLVGRV